MNKENTKEYIGIWNDILKSVEPAFSTIIHNYLSLLCRIANKIIESFDDNHVNKFEEVRLEMFEFVKNHKDLLSIQGVVVMLGTEEKLKLNFPSYDSAENFLDYETYLNFRRQKNELYNAYSYKEIVTKLLIGFDDSKVINLIETLFNRPSSEISTEDIKTFKDVYFVVDVEWKNSKCTIDDLSKKIARRINDFENDVVSPERIEELSFTLDTSTNHLVTDPECTICEESFEENQVLSRMPCGHSFHKMCIKKWTKIEKNQAEQDEEFLDDDSVVDRLEREGLRSVEDEPGEELSWEADFEEVSEIADLMNEHDRIWDEEHEMMEREAAYSETDNEAGIEAEADIEAGIEELEIDDYEFNGDIPELDFYNTEVEDAEIQTKTQCPNCRRYCW